MCHVPCHASVVALPYAISVGPNSRVVHPSLLRDEGGRAVGAHDARPPGATCTPAQPQHVTPGAYPCEDMRPDLESHVQGQQETGALDAPQTRCSSVGPRTGSCFGAAVRAPPLSSNVSQVTSFPNITDSVMIIEGLLIVIAVALLAAAFWGAELCKMVSEDARIGEELCKMVQATNHEVDAAAHSLQRLTYDVQELVNRNRSIERNLARIHEEAVKVPPFLL